VYNAIKKITKEDVTLMKYTVSAISGGTDAQGEVTVKVKDNKQTAMGNGSNTDIVVASAKALINALNKLAYKRMHWDELKKEGI